jgi:hypothetical protein
MPRVEFEHTTPLFQRARAVHALDRAATGPHNTVSSSSSSYYYCYYYYIPVAPA